MRPTLLACQPIRNRVLAMLPTIELQAIGDQLTSVNLAAGQVLAAAGQPTEHAYFVEDGLVSAAAPATASRPAIQVAMIGRDGVVGCQALLSARAYAPVAYVTQIPGPALRIPLPALQGLLPHSPHLSRLCMDAIERLMRQAMQAAASSARDSLAQRCVRWLLMAHDRVEGDDLPVTQEAISAALGVRRSGVTVVASGLQHAGLVRLSRGRITVLDREGLQRHAAGSYETSDIKGATAPPPAPLGPTKEGPSP